MVGESMTITAEQARAIVRAIKQAEATTSAEIFAVLARQSDDYRLAAASFLLAFVFVVSCAVGLLSWWHWFEVSMPVFVLAQMLAAITVLFFAWFMRGFAVRLIPKSVRYRRAHASAASQFLAHGIHHGNSRAGVLVFVSLAERYAEIRCDKSIAAKFEQAFWNECVATLIAAAERREIADGFIKAIRQIGKKLAREFPPAADNPNELADRFVII